MKLSDLDTVIDRRGTGCLKYDFAVQRGKPADVLPFWVADMDFKVAEPILDALRKRVDHGIFGYSESGESYFEALKNWQKENYNWDIEPEWLIKTPGRRSCHQPCRQSTDKGRRRHPHQPPCLLPLPRSHQEERKETGEQPAHPQERSL